MILYPKEWPLLPDGRPYQGEIDKTNSLPHGLGIILLDDSHYYAGEFRNGKRHGRGFIIHHVVTDKLEKVWVNGSYEEVMATAQFDCCGRVTHVDRVGHVDTRMVRHEKWVKEQDGLWENDAFISPVDLTPLRQRPWKWAETIYTSTEYYDNLPGHHPSTFKKTIRSADANGNYDFNGKAFVTVYDDRHLLFCDRYGHLFRLAAEEEYHYDVMRDSTCIKERRSFTLHLAEADYGMLLEEGLYDELVTTALDSAPMTEKARIYFLRVFYQRDSIFRLSKETIQRITRAAEHDDACALFALGRYHIVTKPSPQSVSTSLFLFDMAMKKKLPDAIAASAEAWRYGDMGMVDHEKADKMLALALKEGSEYAAVLQLRELVFGTSIKDSNPKEALQKAEERIHGETYQTNYLGLWFYFKAIALDTLGQKEQAHNFCSHATLHGVAAAWTELAFMKGKADDQGNFADHDAYLATLREGAKHQDVNSRAFLALQTTTDFDKLPAEAQSKEVAQEIIHEWEECYRRGSRIAAEYLGDIYYHGFCLQPKDMEKAWKWYFKAAIWDLPSAYEKLYDMVYYHDKDIELKDHDLLALQGARLGSRKLLDATVMAHTQGRLNDFAEEIEKYYDPIFDAEPQDDTPDDDKPDNDKPDDDGRYDAWG